jgi:tRNA threonylcarbamoyl adenosine modification protein YjeE
MADDSETMRGLVVLPDLDATAALGAAIARGLSRGDAVALWGDLGAGKTTLARAILGALGVKGPVPSPTFTIVQGYETPTLFVSHFDLYRLKSSREVAELGFDDALDQGAVLVEWPERAPEILPLEALHVRLALEEETRNAHLAGPSYWQRFIDVL